MLLSDQSQSSSFLSTPTKIKRRILAGVQMCLFGMYETNMTCLVCEVSFSYPGQAVVLNCRKLASTQISTAQYITSLPINLFPDISAPPSPLCIVLRQLTKQQIIHFWWSMLNCLHSHHRHHCIGVRFKILTFIVIANRFGQGGFLLYAETPCCVMSLYPAARPTTSLYLTRHPHCPRLLLRGAYFIKT